MDIAGIDEIYAVGGAQAIAAFSYGTDQIQPVNLIVGPGNSFVTEAKRQCYGKVGIDFVAGPSEVLVIADSNADPDIVAADLLAQSEHDKEAKGIVVTTDEGFGQAVIKAVEEQLEQLDTREIASRSWADFGEVLLADDLEEAIAYANSYAPEHLEVNVAETQLNRRWELCTIMDRCLSAEIRQKFSEIMRPEPTIRCRLWEQPGYTGGVWVGTFLKTCTYQSMSPQAMMDIAPLVSNLARGEGLIGHARAAEIRMEKNKK